MAITWKEDADSRQNLGASGIIQQNTASFSASDYATGGYLINPQVFGLGLVRGLIPTAYTGTAGIYDWVFVPATTVTPTNAGQLQVLVTPSGGGAMVQASASTDLSGGTVAFLAFGF